MKKTRLLVVDDEKGIRNVLGITLADAGYVVDTAENGEEALALFRKKNPAIVLTDIKMPGMNGITLLKKIKKENPDAEVIMITGHGDMDLAIKSLQNKAVDFVTKPINNDILDIALNRAHEKINMREQLRSYTENLEDLVKKQSARLVEAERLLAIGQTVEGLSSAIKGIASNLEGGIRYFNEMPCFVSIHNSELVIVETNQLFRDRLGDRAGDKSWDIFEGMNKDPHACPVGKTFKTGRGQSSREIVRYMDGSELPVMVHTAPIRNKQGETELVIEIAADISEVNRLQEELRTTQQLYRQLFNEVPCYISVQDRSLKLIETNRRFKEDFGERLDSYCYEVYRHRSRPCNDCPVAKTFKDGKSHQYETVVTSKSGEQYNVLVWTAPIRNAEGEVIQVMEMLTNITQIRQLQGHLTSLGFLMSSISHGIKGMLTGLDGGMYLINSGLRDTDQEKIKEGSDVVNLMVARIRNMVQNILFYAKERELQKDDTDILSFVEDVGQTLEHKMIRNRIEFQKDFKGLEGTLRMDAAIVRIAFINILENAIEAVIADQAGKHRMILFKGRKEKTRVVFEIEDTGIGMDNDTRANLFTLFFSSKGHKGTGLGLYIANRIIRQHGGMIRVESTPGKGSKFTVRLPE